MGSFRDGDTPRADASHDHSTGALIRHWPQIAGSVLIVIVLVVRRAQGTDERGIVAERADSSDGIEVRFLKPGRFGHREDAPYPLVVHTRG